MPVHYAIIDDGRRLYLHTYAPTEAIFAVWDAETYCHWPDWDTVELIRQDLIARGHTFLRVYRG